MSDSPASQEDTGGLEQKSEVLKTGVETSNRVTGTYKLPLEALQGLLFEVSSEYDSNRRDLGGGKFCYDHTRL